MNRYFSLRDEVLHLLDEKSHGYYKRDALVSSMPLVQVNWQKNYWILYLAKKKRTLL